MMSRKNILDKQNKIINSNDVNLKQTSNTFQQMTSNQTNVDLDDFWFDKQSVYKVHVEEVLKKWKQIDDQIWAKIICFERNQRVAKAYLRAPLININSSTLGFDGHNIGLNGFKGYFNDENINVIKNKIGKGINIFIEDNGNISVRQVNSNCDLIVRPYDLKHNALPDQLNLCNGHIKNILPNKYSVIFDLHKFKTNIMKKLKTGVNLNKLETQCIFTIIFLRESSSKNSMQNPVWLLFVNIVALDFLRSKYIDTSLSLKNMINSKESKLNQTNQSSTCLEQKEESKKKKNKKLINVTNQNQNQNQNVSSKINENLNLIVQTNPQLLNEKKLENKLNKLKKSNSSRYLDQLEVTIKEEIINQTKSANFFYEDGQLDCDTMKNVDSIRVNKCGLNCKKSIKVPSENQVQFEENNRIKQEGKKIESSSQVINLLENSNRNSNNKCSINSCLRSKNLKKFLVYSQNSFDSGFYSPSSTDSYNLSNSASACSNAFLYSSKSEKFLTQNNCQFKQFNKPFTNKQQFSYNLPRSFTYFNGTGFVYLNNNYRKYYSSNILNDWN